MSCNGCRVLRKGCSDNCTLRQCLHSIDTPQAQANATVFVAKFFGRAGLMSFISNVTPFQRPSLFQSLLYEAVGRTINPVSGAVGLLWTGNWGLCQAAVETVLCGGALKPLPNCLGGVPELDDVSESAVNVVSGKPKPLKRKEDRFGDDISGDVDLNLTASMPHREEKRRTTTPSEESETTTSLVSGLENTSNTEGGEKKLLRLFF